MGAVPQAGNRFQVVIGGAVQTVFNDINALRDEQGGGEDDVFDDADLKKGRTRGRRARQGRVA